MRIVGVSTFLGIYRHKPLSQSALNNDSVGCGRKVTTKMARKFEEGDVFFAHRILDADGAESAAGEADDGAARASKLALERLSLFGWSVEMLFEEPLEIVGQWFLPSVVKSFRG